MNSALQNLAGPGKPLSVELPDTREIEGCDAVRIAWEQLDDPSPSTPR